MFSPGTEAFAPSVKDLVQELEGQLLELESEKIVLELGMECLSE